MPNALPMPNALRLRIEQSFAIPLYALDGGSGLTIEAWVRPAPMDAAVRLYPKPDFQDAPVRLKTGAYPQMRAERLTSFGSVDLPEGIEGVFFPKPDWRGTAWAVRDDQSKAPDGPVGSALLVDRRHRRQHCVVLFEQPKFDGSAIVLRLPQTWRTPSASDDKTPSGESIATALSAWVPPGVALDVEFSFKTESQASTEQHATQPAPASQMVTVHGDVAHLANTICRLASERTKGVSVGDPNHLTIHGITARRSKPVTGTTLGYSLLNGKSLPRESCQFNTTSAPEFVSLHVPDAMAVFLFQQEQFQGEHRIIDGQHDDLSGLGWIPASWAFVQAPDGVDGILELTSDEVGKVIPAGKKCEISAQNSTLWIPNGYRVSTANDYAKMIGPGLHENVSPDNYTVERYAGVFAVDGLGLVLERNPSELRSAPDELQFGGVVVSTDRWHHLAITWEGTKVSWILDGQVVKSENSTEVLGPRLAQGVWRLGERFRGSVAQLRVWNVARTPDEIRADRFLDSKAANPTVDVLGMKISSIANDSHSVAFEAELPKDPAASPAAKTLVRQATVKHVEALQVAQTKAHNVTQRARALGYVRTSDAHRVAKRKLHFSSIESVFFVRGGIVFRGETDAVQSVFLTSIAHSVGLHQDVKKLDGEQEVVITDWISKSDGIYYHPVHWVSTQALATAYDLTGFGRGDDYVSSEYIGWYLLKRDGSLARYWYRFDNKFSEMVDLLPNATSKQWPRASDLAIDIRKGSERVVWTDGWEILSAQLKPSVDKKDGGIGEVRILVSSASTRHPVSLAIAPDGTIVWLDVEDEKIRKLPVGESTPIDIYSAPNPNRGISLGLIKQTDDDSAVPYVYWVSAERSTLDVPVLDGPGRYIDLHFDETTPVAFNQHVSAVTVSEMTGATWQAAQLSFTSADDTVVVEPIRLDLGAGWTAVAQNVVLTSTDKPVSVYALSTAEEEDRLICAIENDGLPTMRIRWNGQTLSGKRKILSSVRAMKNCDVAWTISADGLATTYIDGTPVAREQFDVRWSPRVFVNHGLGASKSAPAFTVEGCTLVGIEESLFGFDSFIGSLTRFTAWNTSLPEISNSVKSGPGPNTRWNRSIVAFETSRRYLHVGRLDGREPPLSLLPIDLDGGLNVETKLDAAHGKLTLALAVQAEANAHAADVKRACLEEENAQRSLAASKLADSHANVTNRLASAHADAAKRRTEADNRKIAAVKKATARRQEADVHAAQIRADGEKQASKNESNAKQKKDQRIANAQRQRDARQEERDSKEREYNSKR